MGKIFYILFLCHFILICFFFFFLIFNVYIDFIIFFLTIVDFLDKAPIGCITWEFNPTTRKVLHFGFFYRKIFQRIGNILYSYHKNRQFCDNVIGQMMVSQNLDVYHPYDGVSRFSDFAKETKTDIRHFRWLLALMVKKCFPNDYEESCLPFFQTNFFRNVSPPRGSETQLHVPIFQPGSI